MPPQGLSRYFGLGEKCQHIAHFWQFSCNIPLKFAVSQSFGKEFEAEYFGGEASPPTHTHLPHMDLS